MAMDLDWLRDFLALSEHKVFARAAGARHVTQPAFSRRIRALEEWIGTPLFERTRQGAALTPAGSHFLPLAEDLARSLSRARETTRIAGRDAAAHLTVAATHALSFTFFPNWFRERIGSRERGTISLISDSMDGCEEVMLAGKADLLLCHHHPAAPTRLDGPEFRSRAVGGDTLVPVCAPDGEGKPAWPVPMPGDRPTQLLEYSAASGLGRIIAALRPALERSEVVFTSHLAATLVTMARDGDGVAWLPLSTIRDDMDAARLVRAGPPSLDVPVEIRLFHPAMPGRVPDYLLNDR